MKDAGFNMIELMAVITALMFIVITAWKQKVDFKPEY